MSCELHITSLSWRIKTCVTAISRDISHSIYRVSKQDSTLLQITVSICTEGTEVCSLQEYEGSL